MAAAQPLSCWEERRQMGKTKTPPASEPILVKPQFLVRAITRLHLPTKAREFLDALDEGTYEKRGFHRQDGTPEHWCKFDMATWARVMDVAKPHVTRMRQYLVDLRVIQVQVVEGEMWVGYNLNTEEWIIPRKRGGYRANAGRPRKHQNGNERPDIHENQDGNNQAVTAYVSDVAENQDGNDLAAIHRIQNGNENYQSGNAGQIKMITVERDEAADVAEFPKPLRNEDQETSRSGAATAAMLPPAKATGNSARMPKVPKVLDETSLHYQQALKLRDMILGYAPFAKVPDATPKGLAGWAREFRLMVEVDHRIPEQIEDVIAYVLATPFWHPNILSGGKLREKFDTLLIQYYNRRRQGHEQKHPTKPQSSQVPAHRGSATPCRVNQSNAQRRATLAAATGGGGTSETP